MHNGRLLPLVSTTIGMTKQLCAATNVDVAFVHQLENREPVTLAELYLWFAV
jgi:hypothetical protein